MWFPVIACFSVFFVSFSLEQDDCSSAFWLHRETPLEEKIGLLCLWDENDRGNLEREKSRLSNTSGKKRALETLYSKVISAGRARKEQNKSINDNLLTKFIVTGMNIFLSAVWIVVSYLIADVQVNCRAKWTSKLHPWNISRHDLFHSIRVIFSGEERKDESGTSDYLIYTVLHCYQWLHLTVVDWID